MAYQQVTLSTLQTYLSDRYEGTPFWAAEEARLALNEALQVWNALTGFWKSTGTAVTTIDSQWVTVPGALTFTTRVLTSARTLGKSSIYEMDMGIANWEAQKTNTGGNVPNYIKLWAPVGITRIAIWPIDHVGGTTLTFDGVAVTPVLTSSGDYIDIGQEELDVLLGYALHVLAFKRGGEAFQLTKPKYDAFMAAAVTRNGMLASSERFKQFKGLDFTREADPMKKEA